VAGDGAGDALDRGIDIELCETYVVETLGWPQAAIVNLGEYRQFQHFRREREAFFEWLEPTAARNAERTVGLSDAEVLAIIEQARRSCLHCRVSRAARCY
jgi:hypothetical protein